MNTFTKLSHRFQYWAALAFVQEGPPEKLRADLMKQGWQFRDSLTPEEAINNLMANGMAGPMGCGMIPRTIISNAEVEDIFQSDNKELQQRYKNDVRATAARIYGIKP